MVCEKLYRGRIVFECEYCGLNYENLPTSESCEEFCGLHGNCSARISRRAIYAPPVRIIPIANR